MDPDELTDEEREAGIEIDPPDLSAEEQAAGIEVAPSGPVEKRQKFHEEDVVRVDPEDEMAMRAEGGRVVRRPEGGRPVMLTPAGARARAREQGAQVDEPRVVEDEVELPGMQLLNAVRERVRGAGYGALTGLPVEAPERYTPGAVAAGFADTATLGHADELAGAVRAAGGETYREGRGAARRNLEQASGESGFTAGQVLGAAPHLLIPGAPGAIAARGGGAIPRIAAGVAEGAAYGATAGSGHSGGDVGSSRWAEDTAVGSLVGAGASGAVGTAGEGARAVAQRVAGGTADRLRLAALGARMGDMENVERTFPGGVRGAADVARREGLTGTVASRETLSERLPAVRERAIETINGFINRTAPDTADVGYRVNASDPAVVPTTDFVTSMVERVVRPLERSVVPADRALARQMIGILDNVSTEHPQGLTLRALQDIKNALGPRARFDVATEAPTRAAYQDMYRGTRDAMDDAVDRVGQVEGDPTAVQRYRDARASYGLAERAEEWSQREANREAGNRVFSLTDNMAALAAAAATGNPAMLVLGAGLNRAVRRGEHSAAATAFERMRSLAESNPQALGPYGSALANALRRGPGVFAATTYALTQQDPNFRRMTEGLDQESIEDEAADLERELEYDDAAGAAGGM